MASTTWPVYSTLAREHFGRGKVEGEASAVLRVLAARGIEVPEDVRARICACTDTRQLDAWLDRAASADAITDLFE